MHPPPSNELRVVADPESISVHHARTRAVIPALARVATEGRPTFTTEDGLLIYSDTGVYIDARRPVRASVAALRGSDYGPREGDAVLAYLRDTSPEWQPDYRTDVVNTPQGLVVVASNQLVEHSPKFLTTMQIPTVVDPQAQAPHFLRYLDETLPQDMHAPVLEWLGYLLVPDTSRQKAVFLFGDGSNGKSILLGVVMALLGLSSCSFVTLHQLAENRFAIAKTRDKLANIAGETEGREMRSTATWKEYVTGARQYGEHKHGQLFGFEPTARMMLAGNVTPSTADLTHGFHRRLDIWPFMRRFSGDEIDPHLALKLAGETSGILNLALDGLRRLQAQNGFTPSPTITEAGNRYRLAVDSVASFVDDACEVGPDGSVRGRALYEAYKRYCEEAGRKCRQQPKFYDQLLELFPDEIERTNPQGSAHFKGIGLRSADRP